MPTYEEMETRVSNLEYELQMLRHEIDMKMNQAEANAIQYCDSKDEGE